LLHAAQPGPSDAGFTRLVYWFTSSTRLRACKRCLSARLWRNEQIGRFLGTRLRWCKRERMGKRADTENHFCVRHASNQTASQLDLYSCIRKPIKRLWYLTSLATAGLHAACEPGCAHPQTNQPLRAGIIGGERPAESRRGIGERIKRAGSQTPADTGEIALRALPLAEQRAAAEPTTTRRPFPARSRRNP